MAEIYGIATSPDDGRQSEKALTIQRGVCRLLMAHGFSVVTELRLSTGHRADIVALSGKGQIWIAEVKSSLADFRTDTKWEAYRDHCDRLLFAVDTDFPADVIPDDTGLIRADGYGAEILRHAPEHKLSAGRRKAVTLRFARAAAVRLQRLSDPESKLGQLL